MWLGASAEQIARAVRNGETSAIDVLTEHFDHVGVANRILDALRMVRTGSAAAEADLVDELRDLPLAGVPVVVSEDTPIAGSPTWHGSVAARTGIAREDHEVVRRLRGAGAVIIGSARVSELGLWPTTDPTRHPWRSDRSPGGAGGGAAAAVAAGIVPLAFGPDGLGSVRIPAAITGLVGFRSGSVDHGVLATTVNDAALGFAALSGRPVRPVRDPGRLRFAISVRSPLPLFGADRDTRSAVSQAARLLVGLRHDVALGEPTYPPRLARMCLAAWAEQAHDRGAGRDGLQSRTKRLADLGGFALRHGLVRSGERADWGDRCEEWFAATGADMLVVPAIAGGPPARGFSQRGWARNTFEAVRLGAYTAVWSLAGLPAVTVPVGTRRDGVPVSVQLVGARGAEIRLLEVAGQLERVAPWRRHAPGWPRRISTRPAEFVGVAPVAPSGHDRARASNGAGDPGRDRGRKEGADRRRPRHADGAEPAAVRRTRRTGVAQM